MRPHSSVPRIGPLRLVACLWVVSIASVASMTAPVVRAEPACGRAGRPWVAIAFKGDAWSAPLRAVVLADMRAELSLQGFQACPLGSRGSEPPLALIEISAEQADRVRVTIGVHDAITEKRVVRDVDLSEVADDGRGLAVAVAADELLRASWAELALEDAPEPAMEPPPEVDRTLRASLSSAYSRQDGRQRIGARFALEHHGGGQTWLGGDFVLTLYFGERVGGELRVGAREGIDVTTEGGRVESQVFLGGAGAQVALLPRGGTLELAAAAGVSVGSVQLSARAEEGLRARDGAAFAAGAHLGVAAGVLLVDPLELRLDLELGLPLREVEAGDADGVISSNGGLATRAGVGLGVRL